MKSILVFITCIFVSITYLSATAQANDDQSINENNQQKIITKFEKAKRQIVQDLIKDNQQLFTHAGYYGNPQGKKVLYNFYDYHCIYCKALETSLRNLTKEDKQLKVVLLDYPILKQTSLVASLYANAVLTLKGEQMFIKVHDSLFDAPKPLTLKRITSIIKLAGLSLIDIEEQVHKEESMVYIKSLYDIAKILGANATPVLIYRGRIITGAVPIDQIKMILND